MLVGMPEPIFPNGAGFFLTDWATELCGPLTHAHHSHPRPSTADIDHGPAPTVRP